MLKAYNVFQFPTLDKQWTSAEILQAFYKYAVGKTNAMYKRFVFHTRKKEESKSVEAFIAVFQTLIKTCDF